MIKRNIHDIQPPLEMHKDDRGSIIDIFYKEHIGHVAIIDSFSGALRGDHYHKKSIQHILITKGSLEYWYTTFGSDEDPECVFISEGDIITTPPFEIHALRITEDNQFIVFGQGVRGGKDYESDTHRLDYTIIPIHCDSDIKLHLGCGPRKLPGYIHVDIDPYDHIDYRCDIKKLPMFQNESVNIIYSCGTLIYFDRDEVMEVLKEWKRILKTGGQLFISVPDFENIVNVYLREKNMEDRGILCPLF